MRAQLWAGLRALLVLTVFCGVAYPLAVTAVAQVAFKDQADGSLVQRGGEVVGSSLLGQAFTRPEYFQTRPSAAGAAAAGALDGAGAPADPEDLSTVASGASNLGPTNEEFLAAVAERVAAYREVNGLPEGAKVPVDAVTASGSGLDPHISVANARLQARRVAEARRLPTDAVLRIVDRHTTTRALGFLGEKAVNVLKLNLALDTLN